MNIDIFVRKFNKAMETREMNASKLAKKCALTNSTISNYCNGKRFPSIENFSLICKGLGIDPNYFLYDSIGIDDIHKYMKDNKPSDAKLKEKQKKIKDINEWLPECSAKELDCIKNCIDCFRGKNSK